VLIVVGTVVDILTPPDFTAAPLYAAAPLVAAQLMSRRATLAAGVAGCAAQIGVAAYHRQLGQLEASTETATIATVALLSVVFTNLLRTSDRRLETAQTISAAVQDAVLPRPPARLGGLTVAARYAAAQTDTQIGGDLYAVQNTPYGVRLIVGDVRGKGLAAVGMVTAVIGAFREAAEREPTMEGLADRLERALERETELRPGSLEQSEGFTTAVLAELRAEGGTLRVLNRGHPPPLVLHGDGSVVAMDPSCPALPLGMTAFGRWPEVVDTMPFPTGATLLAYTDGVTEARDRDGRFYAPETRLEGRVFLDPEALLDALLQDIAQHTRGRVSDDMAVLAVTHR
jgi:serine phosphatase RsbU (regulator of sigma subunit)